MNKNFIFAILATTLSISGIDILIPILPVNFLRITNSPFLMGVLMGTTSLAAVLLRPISSSFIGKIGLKKSMIFGDLILSVTAFSYFFTGSFKTLAVLRIFFGVGIILFFVSVWSLIGVIIPSEKRGFALSIYTVAFLFPCFYAPFIGTKLNVESFTPFLISGILFLIAVISCFFIDDRGLRSFDGHGFFATLFRRDLFIPGIIIFSVILADASVTVFLPLIALKRFIGNYGLFFTIFSVSTVFFRLYLGRYYTDNNRSRFVIWGMILMFLSFIAVGFAKSLPLLLVSGFLYGTGFALTDPNLFVLIIERRKDFSMTQVMAGYGGFFDFGYAAGPLIMGLIYKNFGESGLYFSASIFVFIGFLISIIYFKSCRCDRIGELC
ncbi:MAG: MFS transporter [Elusimicrobiota bacterium]